MPPVRETFWQLSLKKEFFSIDEVLVELLNQLWNCREAARSIGHSPLCSACFVANITIYGNQPEYCLSPDTLTRLAFFGFELCLDIFDCSPGALGGKIALT